MRNRIYYPYVKGQATFVLTPTGNGSGVSTLRMTASENTTLTIVGDGANFYTNSGGTEGESKTWTIGTSITTIYLKCTLEAKLIIPEQRLITQWGNSSNDGWTSSTNAATISSVGFPLRNITTVRVAGNNTLSGNLSDAPANLTYLLIFGGNTISGDLSDVPANLTYLNISGSNTISGDIADAPANMTNLQITGNNTVSGDIANAPANLTYLLIAGSNTISGDLADAPANLTYLNITGSNTISGDIADAPANLTYLIITGNNTINDYTQGKTFANNFNYLIIAGSQGLSQLEMIDLIKDISAANWGGSVRTFNMGTPNDSMADTTQGGIWGDFSGTPAPSTLATAYKTLIKTKSVTVTLNGITVPGGSGDGTGFPAGFGDWYRS